jgi:FkbM family methyltransferase
MSVLAASATDIVIDARTGRVENANVAERLALLALRGAVAVLHPFHLFGFSYVARAVRTLLPSKKSMQFVFGDDARMRVDYCDAYWSQLVSPNYNYEPAVLAFVEAFRDTPYAFVDGGANHGFWSILATSKAYGAKRAVAVEAASDTFAQLEENRILNNDRFTTLNRAIGAVSGEQVRIYGVKHEARTTVPEEGLKPILDCVSISLDDLADHPSVKGAEAYAVKLDVEGVEVASMNGARRLIETDAVFVYEDHGSDLTHAVTRNALGHLGLRVFWLGSGKAVEIRSPDQLDAIKKSRRYGYDMAATKSQYWISRLEALVNGGTAVRA